MRLKVPLLLAFRLCAAPAQGARVVVHAVPGGVGQNGGFRPFPVFCRGNTVLIHFQTKPKLKATPGPSEARMTMSAVNINLSLRRLASRGKPSTFPLNPNEIEVSCQHGQVRAGAQVELVRRP